MQFYFSDLLVNLIWLLSHIYISKARPQQSEDRRGVQ